MESLIRNFCLGVAARKIVWADPSLRYTRMLLGVKQPTDNNKNAGYFVQTSLPYLFILALAMGTIDFVILYHFQWTLTLAGGHTVSGKQNLLASG